MAVSAVSHRGSLRSADTYFLFDEYLRIVGSTQSRHLTTIQYKHPGQLSKVLVLGSGGLTIGQASPT